MEWDGITTMESKWNNGTEGDKGNIDLIPPINLLGTSHTKTRNMVFTDFHESVEWAEDQMMYLGYGNEVCPTTGKKHRQGVVVWKSPCSIAAKAKKWGCYFSTMKGTLKQAITYCQKEGDYHEWGRIPAPGTRTDLNVLAGEIRQGKSVQTILDDNPGIYHFYKRTLNDIEDGVMRNKFRTEMTIGMWIYGPTGSGKSHYALRDYHPDTHFLYRDDNGWWDGYRGQETVVINDFRGGIKYSEMLQLVDKWPYFVRRRNREPMAFLAKKVIVTSSVRPEECYSNVYGNDSIEQLLRRFNVLTMDEVNDM